MGFLRLVGLCESQEGIKRRGSVKKGQHERREQGVYIGSREMAMLTGLFFTYSESTPLRSSDRDANRNPSDGRGLVGSREERRICDPARPPYPPQTYKGQKAPSSPPRRCSSEGFLLDLSDRREDGNPTAERCRTHTEQVCRDFPAQAGLNAHRRKT